MKLLIYCIICTIVLLSVLIYFLIQAQNKRMKVAIEQLFYEDFYNLNPQFDKKFINKFVKDNTFIISARNMDYDHIYNEKKFLNDFKNSFDKNVNIHYTNFNHSISFILSFDCGEDAIIESLNKITLLYPNIYFGISQCISREMINQALEKNIMPNSARKIISSKFLNNSDKALSIGMFNKQRVYRFDIGEARTFSKFSTETEAKLWSAFNSKNIEQLNEIILSAFDGADDYTQCMYISNNLLHFLYTALTKNNITTDEVYGNNVNLYRWSIYIVKKETLLGSIIDWYKKAIIYIEEHSEKVNNIEIKIEKYIADNYNKDISIATMAEEFKISSLYFSRYFKSQIGSNFLETLNKYRIKKALELLNNTELSMTEISEMTGFNNYKSFARNFKKYTGKIPSEYSKK